MSAVRIRRLPVLDEYVEDGLSAVFVDNQVVALSELATMVLALVGEEGMTQGDLETLLVAEVGEPDGGTVKEALEPILAALVDQSLIALDD